MLQNPRGTVRLQPIAISIPPVLARRDEVSSLVRLVARVERY